MQLFSYAANKCKDVCGLNCFAYAEFSKLYCILYKYTAPDNQPGLEFTTCPRLGNFSSPALYFLIYH